MTYVLRSGDSAEAFVLRHTEIARTELVPEIALHLAREHIKIFYEAERIGAGQPYWAFAWTGGQGLARWLLDHPEAVHGKRVLDIGAGSAITSIAAAKAGARTIVANDTDPLACAATALNVRLNEVKLEISGEDLLDAPPPADLILIGDLFYMPELAERVSRFLETARRQQVAVLYADRPTARQPPVQLEPLANYRAPLTPPMELGYIEYCRVCRLAEGMPS